MGIKELCIDIFYTTNHYLYCFRVYKKGFQKKAVRREDEELRGYMSQWLSWLCPALLPPGQYSLDALQTTSALYVQLRILAAQPAAENFPLLLQALLMKENALSIMLLTQTAKQTNSEEEQSGGGIQRDQEEAAREVFDALLGVLLQCGSGGTGFPAAFASALLPVLDVNGGWDVMTGGPEQEVRTFQ